MMNAGNKPTSWNSVLTGSSLVFYNALKEKGGMWKEEKISQTIEDETFEERDEDFHKRILNNKLEAWCIASGSVNDIKNNASITVDGNQTITTYIAGVGTNGESLMAGAYPAVGNVNTPSLTQLTCTIS